MTEPTYDSILRRSIALVGIALMAVPTLAFAGPTKFCSEGFDKPAVMEFTDQTFDNMTLTIGDETEKYTLFEAEGPHESRALGYEADNNSIIGVTTAKAALGEYPLLPILLYEDRVFWPCEAQK